MMKNELVMHVKIDAGEVRQIVKRIHDAMLRGEVPLLLDDTDHEQEMRARNLMMVRALPCNRE